MKIDLVITELFPGGAEKCLTELAIGLAETGDQVRVCSIASLPQDHRRLLVDRIVSAGIEVSSCQANRLIQFAPARRKLIRWMQQGDADICQTFLFHANVLGTAAARHAGRRVVVGGLRVAERNRVREIVERRAVGQMSSLVCVSRAVQSYARERLRCPPSRSVVIPNGVDITRLATANPIDWSELGWPHEAEVILYVGRLHPQKGIDQLQRRFDELVPKHTARRMLIVGEGPRQSQIDAWIDQLGTDRVKRLAWQTDIAAFMRAARLLVLPSRYEGMPNVILEAMAAGRPVVCTRVEGIDELLPPELDSSHSQTYEIGNESRMVERVNRFCDDAEWSDEIGAANQSRVRHHFSIPAMVYAYRSHYQSLLASHS